MEVFSDDRLEPQELSRLNAFYEVCMRNQASLDVEYAELVCFASEAGIDVSTHYKESVFMQALWFIYLSSAKIGYDSRRYKYQNIEQFLKEYPMLREVEDKREQMNLLQTANWMSILFSLVVAKKSKGLAILLIPKLIEGWDVKYITGSGQKKATSYRVQIFETEGKVVPHSRGKCKGKEHSNRSIGSCTTQKSNRGVLKHLVTKVDPSWNDFSSSSVIKVKNPKKQGKKIKKQDDELDSVAGLVDDECMCEIPTGVRKNCANYNVDIASLESAKLKTQGAAHRWVENVMGRSSQEVSESKFDDENVEMNSDDKPENHSIVVIDPLSLAFPESLSYSNFEMGILSRDVSRTLKITADNQDLDIMKIERFSSSSWGEYSVGTPFSPRSADNILESLFMC